MKLVTSWDLTSLRTHLRNSSAALHALNGLSRSGDIFNFHVFAARDALAGVIEGKAHDAPEVVGYALGFDDAAPAFKHARVLSEAHLIASVLTIKNMTDMFALVVNEAVLGGKLSIEECSFGRVSDAIPPGMLFDKVTMLRDDPWFRYVQAFANVSKHRTLVPHGFGVSFEEEKAGFKLYEFTYRKTTYRSYWVREVLQGTVDVKNALVLCGIELSAIAPAPLVARASLRTLRQT